MKKITFISVLMLVIFIASITCFAATLSVEPDNVPTVSNVILGDGTYLDPLLLILTPVSEIEELPEDSQSAMVFVYSQIEESQNIQTYLEEIKMDKEVDKVIPLEKSQINCIFDLYLNEKAKEMLESTGSITLCMEIAGIHAEDKVVVLHLSSKTNEWEVIPSYVEEDGKVWATFTSASPIIIVVENDEAVVLSPDTSDSSETSAVWAYSILLFSALLLTVSAFSRKRV